MRTTLAIGLLAALLADSAAGQPGFSKPPAVTLDGRAVRIAFEAAKPTDVEVAVLDAAGNVVRHLAAGLIDEHASAPLAPALAQSIVWDGQDNLGRPLPPGDYSVRVGLGMQARLGKVLFHEPGLPFSPRAATVGPDGLVYVLSELGQTKSTFLLQAYTQDGKYVRTIMPYPANLPADRLAGLPRVRRGDGGYWPLIQQAGFRDLYPNSTGMRPQRMLITAKGGIVLVASSKTHNAGPPNPHRLLFVDTDGGVPRASYLGPLTSAENIAHGLCWTALSPDEKWIYTSGQRKGTGNDDNFSTDPHEVVYRLAWDDAGPAKPFIGELYKPGDDRTHLNQPRGIDTDAAGRIYICDHGNNRLAVFDAEGKWLGQLAVDAPDQVAVDRKTGAVYVLTWKPTEDRRKFDSKLIKFAGLNAAGPVAEVQIGQPYCTLSLDGSAKQPTLWLARTFGENPAAKRGVEKVVDLGERLAEPVEVIRHRPLPDVYQIAASRCNDDVFVHSYSEHRFARVDGRTGEVKPLEKVAGHDLAVGPQGQLITVRCTRWSPALKNVEQYDRDGQPVKFAALDGHAIKDVPGHISGHGYTASRGICVSPRGQIVVQETDEQGPGFSIYNADGSPAARKILRGLAGADGSPVMDLAGNLYVASLAKPAGEPFPAVFGDPKSPPNRFYPWMYGSVIKFPPAGGALHYQPRPPKKDDPAWPPPNADKMTALSAFSHPQVFVDGATWVRPGFAVVPSGYMACACYTSRFDVDPFGRAFVPDVGQFSVAVYDADNKPLLRFGDYGNEDSGGAGSAIDKPDIPLSWPYAVSVGRSGVYVSDVINRRIVRVDLTYAAERTVRVTLPAAR